MNQTHYDLLDRSLARVADVGQSSRSRTIKNLYLFLPQRGNDANGELLVVGRAPNGAGWWLPQDAASAHQRAMIIKEAAKCNYIDDALEWVGRDWSADAKCSDCGRLAAWRCKQCVECGGNVEQPYRTSNSAFWKTTKNVVSGLGVVGAHEPWWRFLIYTNLYKFAPDGANPSPRLIEILQSGDLAQRLLKTEIEVWAPRRILLFTRLDWAEPFLTFLGFSQSNFRTESVVCGTVPATADSTTYVVIAPHPQGKSPQQLAEAVCEGFRQLEMRSSM